MKKKNVFDKMHDEFNQMDLRRIDGELTRALTPEEMAIERIEAARFNRPIRDRAIIDREYEGEIFRDTAEASRKSHAIFESFLNMHEPGVSLAETLESNPIDSTTLLFIIQAAIRYGQSIKGRKGYERMLEENPISEAQVAANEFMRNAFLEWDCLPKKEKRERYSSQTIFALDMIDKFDKKEDGTGIYSVDYIVKKLIPSWKEKK